MVASPVAFTARRVIFNGMTRFFAIAATALCLASAAPVASVSWAAEDPAQAVPPGSIVDAKDLSLEMFLWVARPLVIFADTPADPRMQQQLDMLRAEIDRLAERDVVVIVDADPQAQSPIRAKLRPRGFQLVLIGKDGGVKLRKPFPYSVRELTRTIDKMPMRQQEIRDRRAHLETDGE